MKAIKREKRIDYFDFCNIFTNRSFSTREKLFKSIYFVEDTDGNYRIEERINLLGYSTLLTFILLVVPLIIVPCILLFGVLGVFGIIKDSKDTFSRKPTRVDDCRHNIKSTAQLLELTGWGM